MKKRIGYIFWEVYKKKDEKAFEKIAKEKNIELTLFNVFRGINKEDIEEMVKKCDIIYNNSAEEFVIEIVKTLEGLGKKVVESSEAYYYTEDKWMCFIKCKENKIPTLNTILLPENINLAKNELKKFNCWPVILKRVEGNNGKYVEKADNIKEAEQIMKKFWKKEGEDRLPLIAQEFISSPSYRVTVIGEKIVQTAIKEGTNWKHTGNSEKRFRKIKIDKDLEKIIKKVVNVMKIKVCGIDLLKKDGKWLVLEVNSNPGLDFFLNDRERLVGKILDLLIKISNEKKINK
jgi:RimK family alpha-L-glutamate ligase